LISKWRARSHRYFGTIHVPIVELEIQSSSGGFFTFSLCIDSGAVVSLLPRSAADVLGLNWSNGRPIQLGGVGEQRVNAMMHELAVRFPNLSEIAVPFAIADQENVPGLFGRLGLFD